MGSKNDSRTRELVRRSVAAGILCTLVVIQPQSASAQTISTLNDVTFAVFVPCADDGAGEVVVVSSTLHLVVKDGVVVHGNQTNAKGMGLTTGHTYVIGGSPANLVPAGDGDFLYHLSWIGTGADAARFNITAKGAVDQPPTEVIQVSCH